MNNNTMFFAGKARPAEGVTAEKLYGMVTVGLEIDMDTGEILDADCTLSTEVAKRFFNQIIIGYNLSQGMDPLLERIKARYHGDVGKALGAALKAIYRDYASFKVKNIQS